MKCNGVEAAVTPAVGVVVELLCWITSTRAFFAIGWIGAIPAGGVIVLVGY